MKFILLISYNSFSCPKQKLGHQQQDGNQLQLLTMQSDLLKIEELPQHLLSKDKKTNGRITTQFYKNKIRHERNKINALIHNFKPGFLEAEEGEETLKVGQRVIKQIVNVQTASSIFDLNLELGSYSCSYSHHGSSLLLSSSMGHTCIVNWRQKTPTMELNLKQNILQSQFLHNDQIFALAQSSATYIYDNRGIQLHRLDKSLGIQYLPYHFLLVAYDQRKLRYYDTTTGNVIADHVARNPYTVMRQNPSNAIIALGSSKGTVQWWTPGSGTPAVKLFVGAGVTDIGFHKGYMVTASQSVKIWDSRMLKVLYTYPLARKLNSVEYSQSGLLALNYGFRIDIFKEAHSAQQTHPYMTYKSQGSVNNCRFVPFEDLLGLGTTYGFSSIAVPGSGVPFYDTFENNPFQSKKQKREALVHKLLDKLPPETITIDPNVLGNIDRTEKEQLKQQEQEQTKKAEEAARAKRLEKKKMRGKGSLKNRMNRKNIESEKIKRAELTKVINTKLWGKWAQKKKKQKQLSLLQEISEKGLSVAELITKSKKIMKNE